MASALIPEAAPPAERVARASDRLLEALLVAFAAWTAVYHVSVVLRIGAAWAAGFAVLAAVPATWLVLRGARRRPPERAAPPPASAPPRAVAPHLLRALLVANAATALAAAALFAFADPPWVVVWLLWVVAAACAVAYTLARSSREGADDDAPRGAPALDVVIVAAWALGLAGLALFLFGPDADDAYYVHLSSWIEAHGTFPLRDVAFSDEVFPALYFPPASSYEALVGTLAHVTSVATPNILYYAIPPLGSAMAVLALWRLLRTWAVPLAGLALSVALLFLLFDATEHNTLGSFFVGRMWQGKVLFLTVLVPLLFALLHDHADAPSRRRLALLGAAGAAGVGLTTTAVFVVPIIAAGCLAPLALRSPRAAAAGFAAAAAYPAATGAVTLAVGGRTPDNYTDADVVAQNLVHLVLGHDVLALLGVFAVLVGPVLIRRASPAQMLAATALLVGCLVAPRVPLLIFHLSGLGRVLWRLTWVLPTAALVGVLATAAAARLRRPALAAVPAAFLAAAIVLAGQPVWSSGETRLADRPTWKRSPGQVAAARRILAQARPGDVVLAPRPVSATLLVMSGEVTTVSPRGFYTRALRDLPEAHVAQRQLLARFVGVALGKRAGRPPAARQVRRALRVVGVDLACVPKRAAAARRVVAAAGYAPALQTRALACLRPR